MKVRWKRILAFVIDWNLAFLLPVAALVPLTSLENGAWGFLLVPLMIGTIALVVLRDRIFNGASPGKRMMHLRVYDKKTLAPATAGACTVHNLFLFLLLLEGVMVLVTGETLGDRAAGTVVLSAKDLEEHRKAREEGRSLDKKMKGRHIVLIALMLVLWLLLMSCVVQMALHRQKDTEEYAVAYAYLLQSDAWEELDAEESQVRLTQYSITTNHAYPSEETTKTAQLVFRVAGKEFLVVCRWENGSWRVLENGTNFH